MPSEKSCKYIFIDESGNSDFSPSGTRYFTFTSLLSQRPFLFSEQLAELKYDLMDDGLDVESFHASEDRQSTRNKVFDVIRDNHNSLRIDSIVIEKAKTDPSLQSVERFYPKMLGYLLKYVVDSIQPDVLDKVIVITDSLPVRKRRKAIEKAIKITLAEMLPEGLEYQIVHHDSKSNFGLQIADYCSWAIFRKWEREDARSYGTLGRIIRSESDIFSSGQKLYY